MERALEREEKILRRHFEHRNVSHFYIKFDGILWDILSPIYRATDAGRDRDPLEAFAHKNSAHPEIEKLQDTLAEGDQQLIGELIKKISADRWRTFLKSARRSSARAFYAYLARAEGRKKKGYIPEMAAPILEQNETITSARGKCEAIAREFAHRMAAPSETSSEIAQEGLETRQLPPSREVLQGGPMEVRQTEVHKAIHILASYKTSGPD